MPRRENAFSVVVCMAGNKLVHTGRRNGMQGKSTNGPIEDVDFSPEELRALGPAIAVDLHEEQLYESLEVCWS